MKTIVITGTKGKTSVARIFYDYLIYIGKNSLLIDSTGCSFNGKRYSNKEQSLINYNFKSPNVTPARFIPYFEKFHSEKIKDAYIVMEASYSNYLHGLGIEGQDIGVLLNIYNDHINGTTIKDKNDLLKWKSFSWSNLKDEGIFISNLDNEYTERTFHKVKQEKIGIKKGSIEDNFGSVTKDYNLKDLIVFGSDKIKLISSGEIINVNNSSYTDSIIIENICFVIAICISLNINIQEFERFWREYSIPFEYQRVSVWKNKESIVILDKSHQVDALKNSLNKLSEFPDVNFTLIMKATVNSNMSYLNDLIEIIKNCNQINKIYIYRKYESNEKEEINIRKLEQTLTESGFGVDIFFNEIEALESSIKNNNSTLHLYYDLETVTNLLKEYNYG